MTMVNVDNELYEKIKVYVEKNKIDYSGGVRQFINKIVRDKLIKLRVLESTVNSSHECPKVEGE